MNPQKYVNYSEISLSEFRLDRVNGVITREEYWRAVSEKLRLFSEFQEIAKKDALTFRITPDALELDIPIKKFNSFVTMQIDVDDIRSAPLTVISEGSYELFQAELLILLGMQSQEFIDIGANMGFYSLVLPKLNPKLHTISFEPQPKIFNFLEKNLKLNCLQQRVTTNNCALGSINSTLTMFIPKFTGSGGGSFFNLHENEGNPETIQVPVHIMDDYLGTEISPDLIKIDVEGFEYEAIIGGLKTIKRNKPTIVIELLRKWMKPSGKHPQDVLDLLISLGYLCFGIDEGLLLPIKNIDEETLQTNFLIIHKDRKNHFSEIEKFIKN